MRKAKWLLFYIYRIFVASYFLNQYSCRTREVIMESVLITGASGFIGSFIVEEALKRKFGVWAGIRPTSSKRYLKNRKIHFLELDFAHPNELRAQLSGHKGTYSKFDYIIHCAGVTKCSDKKTFDYVNYLQTKYFIDTLKELNMVPKQFIYISTLSVFGPVREKDYTPISGEDTPMPNTAYGLSKLKAELYIQSIPGFPYVIYRPTEANEAATDTFTLVGKTFIASVALPEKTMRLSCCSSSL